MNRLGLILERWKLLRPSATRVPTPRAWLLLLATGAAVTVGLVANLYPFLAVTARAQTDILVVEGWVPDFALRAGLEEFRRGNYREIISTGGPVETGELLVAYGSHAHVGRATLEKLGAPTAALHAVPAPRVMRDRTYVSAVALRDWFRQRGPVPAAINIVTTDVHARRTRLLFENAFGPATRIGVIAVPDERFDVARWWRSSQGVRTVMEELIGYIYARCFSRVADDLKNP